MDIESPPSVQAQPPVQASARPVLTDLIAAGLVSHEMIGDPARLGSEAEALRALCAAVSGPVWRLDPFHYAFRARPGDLGGALAATDPAGWSAAIGAALREALGTDPGGEAIWIGAAEMLPGEGAKPLPEAPLLLLRAQEAAVAEGLAAADPGTQAVVHARYAVEAARLAERFLAGAEPGSALARRLAVIETRQEEIVEMLVERAGEAAVLGRLAAALTATIERLDAQAAALAGLAAETGILAGRVAALDSALDSGIPAAEAFRQDLGLTLAEFLARLEQAAAGEGALAPASPAGPALAPRLG